MLGPLPRRYVWVVWLAGLLAFAGLAATASAALPLSAVSAAVAGLVFGSAAVLLYLHDFSAHKHPAPVRVRRHH